eukprot:Seg476.11 transcript_id=Seg476.11/GoldUCD/mRNA.D3Y31 product="hypothetical protein" protein_id=Seg476.11/GoldUCD/D3Y31
MASVPKFLLLVLRVIPMTLTFLWCKLLLTIPFIKKRRMEKMKKSAYLTESQVAGCIYNWQMYKTMMWDAFLKTYKTASHGMPAPDAMILKVGQSEKRSNAQRKDASADRNSGEMATEMEPSDKCGTWKSTTNLEKTSIWQLMRPGIPLVINFGSCS